MFTFEQSPRKSGLVSSALSHSKQHWFSDDEVSDEHLSPPACGRRVCRSSRPAPPGPPRALINASISSMKTVLGAW